MSAQFNALCRGALPTTASHTTPIQPLKIFDRDSFLLHEAPFNFSTSTRNFPSRCCILFLFIYFFLRCCSSCLAWLHASHTGTWLRARTLLELGLIMSAARRGGKMFLFSLGAIPLSKVDIAIMLSPRRREWKYKKNIANSTLLTRKAKYRSFFHFVYKCTRFVYTRCSSQLVVLTPSLRLREPRQQCVQKHVNLCFFSCDDSLTNR